MSKQEGTVKEPDKVGRLPDGWVLDKDLSQGHVEDYFAAVNGEDTSGSMSEEYGRTLRAAIVAGWFSTPQGLQPESVRKMKPAVVKRAALAIWEFYADLESDDPNS